MYKGIFITIEGIDGSGKSTQMELLADYLKRCGIDVLLTREPGGTAIGERIRDILLDKTNKVMVPITEALLYAASRAQHVAQVIKPALEQGRAVLCDRFVDSSLVYQGYARGLGIEFIEKINEPALAGVWPDVTLLLDVAPEIAWSRIAAARSQDRLEDEGVNFLKSVYEGYHKIAALYPQRIYIVDAEEGIENIHKKMRSILEPKLNKYRLK